MRRLHVIIIVALGATALLLAGVLGFVLGRDGDRSPAANRQAETPASATQSTAPAPPAERAPAAEKGAEVPGARDEHYRRLIVGNWANGNCDTDNGERFAAGGRYDAYEAWGRWSIDDGQLSTTVTHAQQDPNAGLGEGEITPVPEPETLVARIVSLDRRHLVMVSRGERVTLIRCPSPTV